MSRSPKGVVYLVCFGEVLGNPAAPQGRALATVEAGPP